MTYDPDNIFAKVLRGEIPAHTVYEDADTLALMDIMPRADGHVLVIPKTPARNLLDANTAQLTACLDTAQRVGKAMQTAFGADGITLQQFSEAAGGQVVFHLHFHVIPRKDGVPMRPPGTMADQETLAAQAETLRAALA